MTLIKIDYDEKISNVENFVTEFEKRFRFLDLLFREPLEVMRVRVQETRKGFHFYVRVDFHRRISDLELVVFQLVLLSDYKREGFNLVRIVEGNTLADRWNILFVDNEFDSAAAMKLELLLGACLIEPE